MSHFIEEESNGDDVTALSLPPEILKRLDELNRLRQRLGDAEDDCEVLLEDAQDESPALRREARELSEELQEALETADSLRQAILVSAGLSAALESVIRELRRDSDSLLMSLEELEARVYRD